MPAAIKYHWASLRPGERMTVALAHLDALPGFRSTAASAARRHGMLLEVNEAGSGMVNVWRVDTGDGRTRMQPSAIRAMRVASVAARAMKPVNLCADVAARLDRLAAAHGMDCSDYVKSLLPDEDDGAPI